MNPIAAKQFAMRAPRNLRTKKGKDAVKEIEKVRVRGLRAHVVDAQKLRDVEKKNADRSLTDKQRQFVRFWSSGETPRTASILAGYSEESQSVVWRMQNDPAILKIYREEKKLYEEAGHMTRRRVMNMLEEAYNDAKLLSEPATMVAAARELGKLCGYYEPDKHVHVHMGGKLMDRMNSLSDAELLKIINEPEPDTVEGEVLQLEGPT